jgi:DNA-binding GntR family transcriptional regulator
MQPLTRREPSIREKAYHLIQQKIVTGELTAGMAISELSLAKDLSSSRTPIREAISQLVSEGVLEQIPNRGTIVTQFNRQDILELYELREALEVYAVEKVSQQKMDSSDQERLYGLVDEVQQLHNELAAAHQSGLNQEQMQRFVRADLAYHTLLLRLAGNRRILKVVQDTRLLMRIFSMRREGHDQAQLIQIHRFHREVLDAVVRADGEAAKRLLREHIQLSRQERLQSFDRWEREISLSQSLPALMDLPVSD